MFARRCTTRAAVILAAGSSTRTRPLTSERPKPLIPLLGKPLIAHILDQLVGQVERVTLVVGYRETELRAALGDAYQGMSLHYVTQRDVNGTASALMAITGMVEEPFFLLYGDNLISREDLLGVCGERYALAGLPVEDPRSFGVLDLVADQVRGIIEKPEHPPANALANPGIYHFDQDIFPLLFRISPSPRGEYELTDLISMLAAETRVGYHVCRGFWVPVGTPWEALNAAMFLLARRAPRPARVHPEAQLAEGVMLVGSVEIGRAMIGAGSRIIGPTVIGDGCEVGAGALIEGSALEARARIGPQAVVQRSVLAAGAEVGALSLVQSSWIDEAAQIGQAARLIERRFAALAPNASVGKLLSRDALTTRGTVVGPRAQIAQAAQIEPGTIVQ